VDEKETGHMNPYNCTKPGYRFVGYDGLRKDVLKGFLNGNSYAVLGGRRCGKTSLLMQIEKDLQKAKPRHFHPLPRRLSIQELGSLTPDLLFEQIYHLVVQEVQAEHWIHSEPGKEYQNFLKHLDNAGPTLNKRYGSDWLVILLIDELDAAISYLIDDQFFQNLRNLLMESRFHRHFRLVATGVKEMARLISSGSSPLNNLRNKYLGILTKKKQAKQLVNYGFPAECDDEALFRSTGRHPYLLQGVLEKLWPDKTEWDKKIIRTAARDFLGEHKDFQRWLDAFGPAEQAVYRCLAEAPQGTMSISAIRNKIDRTLIPEIDEALTVLSYHGVVDDSDQDEPEIAGTMFKDWYLTRSPIVETGPVSSAPQQPKAPDPSASTRINIQVSPTIAGASIHHGFTPEEVTKLSNIINQLKKEISNLPIDEQTKMEAQHALDEGIKKRDKNTLKSSLVYFFYKNS
jgi:hypothetical protein